MSSGCLKAAFYFVPLKIFGLDSNGNGVIDPGENKLLKKVSLGKGLSVTPNIHVGKQEGSKAFVQTSTGAIKTIEQKNPGGTKSGVTSWEEVE